MIALAGCAPEVEAPTEPPTIVAPPAVIVPPKLDAPEPSTPQLLTPVAFREGRIELAAWADRAYAVIDGEPIPLQAGQAVARDPSLGLGLGPDKQVFAGSHELLAFASTHVVYAEHFERAGSAYFGYAWSGDRWAPIVWPSRGKDPRIETHYTAIVATGDALLGLRRHAIRSELWDYGDEDDPSMQARLQQIGRELGKAPRGFEVLAGSPSRTPKLPKGFDAGDAVATSRGEIVALGHRHRTGLDDESGPARILSWAPGESEATIDELPGLADPFLHQLGIWASGDSLLIGGLRDLPGDDDQPYLAGRDGDGGWTELALDLPMTVRERVASATVTPTGELWIVTGAWNYASNQPCRCLWRKPADGAWQAVTLEPGSLFRDAEPRWAHVLTEQTWIEVPAGSPPPRYPAARSVLWAGGAIWVTAELGPSYPTARELVLADPRTVLFASVPVDAPRELIATDRLFDERVDRRVADANFTPGSDDCRTFHMRVVDDPDGAGRDVQQLLVARLDRLEDVAMLDNDDGWARASMIYVGELDGRPQLIVEASGWNPKSAVALADGFAQVLERPLALDCRPRELVRIIERFR